jgi:hypothetical protein
MRKTVLLFFCILVSVPSLAQNDFVYDLKGMENTEGASQLFYRVFREYFDGAGDPSQNEFSNHVKHFDTAIVMDSLFLLSSKQFVVDDGMHQLTTAYTPDLHAGNHFWATYTDDRYGNSFSTVYSGNGSYFDASGYAVESLVPIRTDSSSHLIVGLEDYTVLLTLENDSLPSQYYERNLLVKTSVNDTTSSECENYAGYFCHINDSLRVLQFTFMSLDTVNNNRLYLQRNDSLFVTENIGDSLSFLNAEFSWSSFGHFTFSNDAFEIIASTQNHTASQPSGFNKSDFRLIQSTNDGIIWTELLKDTVEIVTSNIIEEYPYDFFAGVGNQLFYWNQLGGKFTDAIVEFESDIKGLYLKPGGEVIYVLTNLSLIEYNIETEQQTILRGLLSSNQTEPDAPTTITLHQNYPNPFNPSTVISYQLAVAGEVRLVVYDVLGREVAVLVDEPKAAGNYEITWQADDISSGVYFYQLVVLATGETITKRMTLIK